MYLILGVGWAMAINSFFVTIYYNIIIAWCLFYLFASFRKKLQWSDCGNWWNTDRCLSAGCNQKKDGFFIRIISMYLDGSYNSTDRFLCLTANRSSNCTLPALPPEEYFE
jgi:hypothetical protein